jgi:O-antigen/teichoic acid export membrane protein
MSSVGRLINNSSWNAIAFVVGVALNLLSLPYVIYHIGVAEFGLAGLVMACVAPALIFSNTLNQVTTRELAYCHANGEHEAVAKTFSTALTLALIGGFGITALVIVFGPLFASAFFQNDQLNEAAPTAFAIAGFGWLLQCMSMLFQARLAARQDFFSLSLVSIGTTLASTLFIFIVIPIKPSEHTFLVSQALGFGCGLAIAFTREVRGSVDRLLAPRLYKGPLWKIVHFSSWQFPAQVGGMISGQADRYMLGAYLGHHYVGLYNVAQRLEEVVYIGVLKLSEVLFPHFSRMDANDPRREDVMFRTSWIMTLIATAALGAIIPVADAILRIWTNNDVANEASAILITLSLAGMLGSGTNVFMFFLLGSGDARTNAFISLFTAAFVILSSAALIPLFGWSAAGTATLIGMIAQLALLTVIIFYRFKSRHIIKKLLFSIIIPIMVGVFVSICLMFILANYSSHHGFITVGLCYAFCALTISIAVIVVSLLGPYGDICLNDLKSIKTHLLKVVRK